MNRYRRRKSVLIVIRTLPYRLYYHFLDSFILISCVILLHSCSPRYRHYLYQLDATSVYRIASSWADCIITKRSLRQINIARGLRLTYSLIHDTHTNNKTTNHLEIVACALGAKHLEAADGSDDGHGCNFSDESESKMLKLLKYSNHDYA